VIVRLLGSAGFMPTGERETCCALLRHDDEALVIDAGTGIRRLVTEPALLEGVERLHVILTHFHLDHVIGLFYLGELSLPVDLWGAGERLEGIATSELVQRLLAPPFAPPSIRDEVPTAYELGAETQVGSFTVASRVQRMHSNPTLALRVDGIVWCTDTGDDPENEEFAQGASVLFHDAFRAAVPAAEGGHTGAANCARLAAAAGVDRLVLIHLSPDVDEDALLRHASPHFEATVVGRDGLELEVS
jgi:ribonuclease BN (tRNA processing enzyme)